MLLMQTGGMLRVFWGLKETKKETCLQISIARQDTTSEMYNSIPPQMGMATAIKTSES